MTIDYKKIGFRAGLEIHQQLEGGKLFCSCPGVLRQDEPSFEIKRKLHLVAGEGGKVDVAAKYQHSEDKEFIYQAYDSTCLVELDSEPPHRINPVALNTALEIAILLNCTIIPLTQIMRKTVINGSNTGGFQRTVMIARDGYIETSKGKVGIDSLFLEEDSARPILKEKNRVTYRLDRLGIPLVEITTKPDLKSAEHVKEAALIIGDIIRSSKVRRGIGTIRQDLNISIKGSHRVEIKGFQDTKIMEKTVNLEITRQEMYLDFINYKFKLQDIVDVTDLITPELTWMKNGIESGYSFVAFRLPEFNGRLKKTKEANVWMGHEISGYAKTRGFGGIVHSDEDMNKYKFSLSEIKNLEKKLEVKKNDAWIMVLGNKHESERMISELIFPFLCGLKNSNPSEVRNCLADGSTEFLRPMPGSSRMYPETDCELLHLGRNKVNEVKRNLSELRSVILKKLKKEGLSQDMLTILFKENKIEEFKEINHVIMIPKLVGKALLLMPKEIAGKVKKPISEIEKSLTTDILIFILEKVKSKELSESDLKVVLEKIVNGESVEKAIKIEKVELGEIESKVKKIIESNPGLRPNAYMGIVMKEFKGKLSGGDAMKVIMKVLG